MQVSSLISALVFALFPMFLWAQIPHSTLADTAGMAIDLAIIERKMGTLESGIKDNLVAVKVDYFSFDKDGNVDKNQLYSGVLVVHKSIENDIRGIFEDLRRDTFPVAKVIPINKYGLDADSTGWDDQKSMLDNNTSVFNYRRSTSSNRLSKHAMGLAIDINPLFNPYEQYELDGKFVEPEGAYYLQNRVGTIHDGNIVRYFEKRGWTWGGRWGNPIDYQHFQKTAGRSAKHLLMKHNSIKDFFRINERTGAITIYKNKRDKKEDRPEFVLYPDEKERFLAMLEHLSMESLMAIYEKKGSNHFDKFGIWAADLTLLDKQNEPIRYDEAIQPKRSRPPVFDELSLKGLRIAVDPGHFAGNHAEALMERRYIVREDGKILFYEAKNAYATAALLTKKLKAAGAEVLITHRFGKSSTGADITDYLKKNGISKRHFKSYARFKAFQKSEDYTRFRILTKAFSKEDLAYRATRINAFAPDMTLVLHFNVSNEAGHGGDVAVAKDNYSMLFVPGAFMKGELADSLSRFHFLRLLATDDLEVSTAFAAELMDNMEKALNTPRVPPGYYVAEKTANYLEGSCIKTDIDGVYARNLSLTRTVLGPMAYVEAYFQNNVEVSKTLNYKDMYVRFGGRKQWVSKKNEALADALFDAIQVYFK